MNLENVTPLILTFNEAPNIARCLDQLTWAKRIVVVDSLSSDDTVGICRRYPNVEVFPRRFDVLATQWNYGINETKIQTDWILALDCDYFVSRDFSAEMKEIQDTPGIDAYEASFRYGVFGEILNCGAYPPVKVLFRRGKGMVVQDGHAQRLQVSGGVSRMATPLLHDDWKSMQHFVLAQTKYMDQEIDKLWDKPKQLWTIKDHLRARFFLQPFLMFFHCYFVRGGIFDGRRGLYYAIQRMTAESIFVLKYLEKILRPLPRVVENEPRKAANQ